MRHAIVFASVLLAACASPEPISVKIPVSVPCLGEVPKRPVKEFGASTGKPYPGHAEAVRIAEREWSRWEQYANSWEATAAGCIAIKQGIKP